MNNKLIRSAMVTMMGKFVFGIVAFVLLSGSAIKLAYAQEMTFEEVMATFDGPLMVRVSEGTIHSLNLNDRTGIIGGHKYWFGPTSLEIPLQVKMYQSSAGALELLQEGMEVEITYGDTGTARVAVKIHQLKPGANIQH